MDAWSPEATVALNGAIANGHCAFPDKTVPRHKDFIMIACANTTGAGATMDYVGRNKQDGATLDRFVSLYWPLDEALEASMIANQDWLTYVRHVRAKAASSGINPKPIVSPRASIHGEALLAAGLEWQTVVDICLRKGLSDAQWGMIS
jgi:cobaltochelatase CobS